MDMMLPTHALVGLAVAAPLVAVAPDLARPALVGALFGSVVPDLDMYAGHRRRFHYPTVAPLVALPVAGAAALLAAPVLVGGAFALIGAALHCRMDRYGGGLELRPWEATSERAVFDHVRERWLAPKRWVRYDGAPEDVLLAALVGLPLLFVLDGPFRRVVAVALAVGGAYGVLRRPLAALAPQAVDRLPDRLHGRVPDRYRE